MPDTCGDTVDAEEDLEYLRTNFRRYYGFNRAPVGIFLHARWFRTGHHLDALDRFVDELLELGDVYVVTPLQVLEWVKRPTSVEMIKTFQPWSCDEDHGV